MPRRAISSCSVLLATLLCCGTARAQPTVDVVHAFPSLGSLRPSGPLVRAANGTFFGISTEGGSYNLGTVFAMTPAGDVFVLHEFDGVHGAGPSSLIQGRDSSLYGTTRFGGDGYSPDDLFSSTTGLGTVFRIGPGGAFTVMHQFTQSEGGFPQWLIQGSNGAFYGTVNLQSPEFTTKAFRMQADGTTAVLGVGMPRSHYPTGPFVEDSGSFYVLAQSSANFGLCGLALSMTSAGEFSIVYQWSAGPFAACLDRPIGGLAKGPGGYIYGASTQGLFALAGGAVYFYADAMRGVWAGDDSSLYALTTFAVLKVDATGVNRIHIFADAKDVPQALTLAPDGTLFGTASDGGTFGFGRTSELTAAGAFSTLHDFSAGTEGARPIAPVMQAADGNLYGVTSSGGPLNGGTVFRSSIGGDLEVLHAFDGGSDFLAPATPLIQVGNGDFYGTTFNSAFAMTPSGGFTRFLLRLPFLQESGPSVLQGTTAASLVEAQDGQLYGTTQDTSASYLDPPNGTVFRMTPDGVFAVQHSFTNAEGEKPAGELLRASNGLLYGTTRARGGSGLGTVFKTTLDGMMTTLHSFGGGTDGASPVAPLAEAQNGSIFGTTPGGDGGSGTLFAITPPAAYTQLHRFAGGAGGAQPRGKLIQADDGNLYGVTMTGGAFDRGTIFRIAPNGGFAVVHSFSGADGERPHAGLIRAADGHLYGTTEIGGPSSNGGVLYRVTLPPCTDTVWPSYNAGTLNLAFALASSGPATFSTWLVSQSGVFNLWSAPVPAISPVVSFNLPIAGFPAMGNVGFLTVLNAPGWSGACYDWQVVDTGGAAGAKPDALKEQVTRKGLVPGGGHFR